MDPEAAGAQLAGVVVVLALGGLELTAIAVRGRTSWIVAAAIGAVASLLLAAALNHVLGLVSTAAMAAGGALFLCPAVRSLPVLPFVGKEERGGVIAAMFPYQLLIAAGWVVGLAATGFPEIVRRTRLPVPAAGAPDAVQQPPA